MRLLLLLLFIFCAAVTQAEESDSNTEKLSAIKEQIDSLQTWLKDAKNQHDELYKSIKASEKSIGELETQTSQLTGKVKEREKKIAALENQEILLKEKISTSQTAIKKYVRSSYMLNQQEPLKLLLNAEDPAAFSRLLTYYDYLNRAHSEKINQFKTDISELNALQEKVKAEKADLKTQADALHKKQSDLNNERESRKQLMAELDTRINSKDDELKKLQQDRAQLEKIIASVTHTTTAYVPPSDTSPFASWKGKLPWPLAGKVLHRFGEARVKNKVAWEGLTIKANEGTPVHAVYHGRVVFADALRGFGLLVIVDHGNNYMSLYAHNQKIVKTVGDDVKSGDNIAVSGSSDSVEPALYFEIRQSGKPQNPSQWLSQKP